MENFAQPQEQVYTSLVHSHSLTQLLSEYGFRI